VYFNHEVVEPAKVPDARAFSSTTSWLLLLLAISPALHTGLSKFDTLRGRSCVTSTTIIVLKTIVLQKFRWLAYFAPVLMLFGFSATAFFEVNPLVHTIGESETFVYEKTVHHTNFYQTQVTNLVFDEICEEVEIEDDNTDDDDNDDHHQKIATLSVAFQSFYAPFTASKFVFEADVAALHPPKTALYILYSTMKIPFFC
jgi:hypothetical protein